MDIEVKLEEVEVKQEGGTPIPARVAPFAAAAAATPPGGPQPMQGVQHSTPLPSASAAVPSYNTTPPQSTLLQPLGSTNLLPSMSGAEIESLRSVLPKGFHHAQLSTPGSVPSNEERGGGGAGASRGASGVIAGGGGVVVMPEPVLALVTGHVQFLEACGE